MSAIPSSAFADAWLRVWQVGALQFREWLNFMGPFTVGGIGNVVNINAKSSADPAIEEDVTQNVASYGRQLGRITDVLRVVLDEAGLTSENSKLTFEQRVAVDQFRDLAAQIDAVKKAHEAQKLGVAVSEVPTGENEKPSEELARATEARQEVPPAGAGNGHVKTRQRRRTRARAT